MKTRLKSSTVKVTKKSLHKLNEVHSKMKEQQIC